MNKKAQGLPINFIVIAAIAIIVMVLVALFLFGGFRTEVVSSQTAANACSSKCLTMQRQSSVKDFETTAFNKLIEDTGYCTPIDLKDQGLTKCDTLAPCTLQYKDQSAPVKC